MQCRKDRGEKGSVQRPGTGLCVYRTRARGTVIKKDVKGMNIEPKLAFPVKIQETE